MEGTMRTPVLLVACAVMVASIAACNTPTPGDGGPAPVATAEAVCKPATAAGAEGAMGASGTQGPQGPAGPQGLQGPKGDRGSDGPMGITGPGGPQGPSSPGPQGMDGPQGPQGPLGPQGPAGPKGADGAATGLTKAGTYEATATLVMNPMNHQTVTALCTNAKDVVLNGGCHSSNIFESRIEGFTSLSPTTANVFSGWACTWYNADPNPGTVTISATVTCVAVP